MRLNWNMDDLMFEAMNKYIWVSNWMRLYWAREQAEARSVSLVYLVTYLILAFFNSFHKSQYHKTTLIKVS
jgi:hypothetical protein